MTGIAAQLTMQEGGQGKLYICIDSIVTLTAQQLTGVESKPTLECHNTLNSLAGARTLESIRIPGHSDFKSNEIADDLARLGAGQLIMGIEPAVGIFYSQIKKKFLCQKATQNHKRG